MSQQRTYLRLIFASTDITEDITPDLLSFSYTDNESAEADTINITLKDEKGKWAGRWSPDHGETIKASIIPGTVEGPGRRKLDCGTFYVDSLRAAGAPRTCEIGGVSVPLDMPIRRKTKTRAWEKKNLKGIAQQIADESKLKLFWDTGDNNPTYDREDQKRESDLGFLMRLCESAGLSLKVTDERLVIFDQSAYEKKPAVMTLTLGESEILSWDFSAAISERYKSVTVKYRDPKALAVAARVDESIRATDVKCIEYTYTDPEVDSSGQDYEMKTRAKTIDEAKRLARAKIRELNRRAITGTLTLIGDIRLAAGIVLNLKGFGRMSGRFFITQATHEVGSGGYTTQISVTRVNTNY